MGHIAGREYSSKRKDEYGETEYYVEDFGGWYTKDEIKAENAEQEWWMSEDRNKDWNPMEG